MPVGQTLRPRVKLKLLKPVLNRVRRGRRAYRRLCSAAWAIGVSAGTRSCPRLLQHARAPRSQPILWHAALQDVLVE